MHHWNSILFIVGKALVSVEKPKSKFSVEIGDTWLIQFLHRSMKISSDLKMMNIGGFLFCFYDRHIFSLGRRHDRWTAGAHKSMSTMCQAGPPQDPEHIYYASMDINIIIGHALYYFSIQKTTEHILTYSTYTYVFLV